MRIAAAQAHAAWGDPRTTAGIVTDWIEAAAEDGVQLVAFGEAFLGGYPIWVDVPGSTSWNDPLQKRAFARYLDGAVELDGPEVARIVECARDRRVFTYLGVAERGAGPARGTVRCTLLAIDPARGVLSAHRKLMPTFAERLVWAPATVTGCGCTRGRAGCGSAA